MRVADALEYMWTPPMAHAPTNGTFDLGSRDEPGVRRRRHWGMNVPSRRWYHFKGFLIVFCDSMKMVRISRSCVQEPEGLS